MGLGYYIAFRRRLRRVEDIIDNVCKRVEAKCVDTFLEEMDSYQKLIEERLEYEIDDVMKNGMDGLLEKDKNSIINNINFSVEIEPLTVDEYKSICSHFINIHIYKIIPVIGQFKMNDELGKWDRWVNNRCFFEVYKVIMNNMELQDDFIEIFATASKTYEMKKQVLRLSLRDGEVYGTLKDGDFIIVEQ